MLGFGFKSSIDVHQGPLDKVVYLQLGDTTLELLAVKGPQAKSAAEWVVGCRSMALEVDDMNAALGYLKGKGVPATWGLVDLGDSFRAEIQDPDGLGIELRQWKK